MIRRLMKKKQKTKIFHASQLVTLRETASTEILTEKKRKIKKKIYMILIKVDVFVLIRGKASQ